MRTADRFSKSKGDFFRESLIIQRQYAEYVIVFVDFFFRTLRKSCRLFVNSQLLRGIKEPSDVVGMPEEKRALAIRAMRNAQKCLDICLHGENVCVPTLGNDGFMADFCFSIAMVCVTQCITLVSCKVRGKVGLD